MVFPLKFPDNWVAPEPGRILRPRYDLLGNDWLLWSAHNPTTGQTPVVIETRAAPGSMLTYGHRGLFARGFSRVASAGVGLGIWDNFLPASDGLTVAAVAAPVASTNRKSAFCHGNIGGSPFNSHQLGFNYDQNAGAESGALTIFSRNTAGTEVGVKAQSAVDGKWHAFVGGNSTTASSGYIYRDGQALTLAVNTSMTGTYSGFSERVHIGNLANFTASGDYVMDDPLLLVIGWRRQVPASHAALISKMLFEDPYSVFEEQRPFFFFPAAAVGGGTIVNPFSGRGGAAAQPVW